MAQDVGHDFCQNLLGSLGLDQADIALGNGLSRQDSFGARTTIAAMDAIDGQRRPRRQAFKIVTFLRLIEALQAKRSFDLIHVDRQLCQRLAF